MYLPHRSGIGTRQTTSLTCGSHCRLSRVYFPLCPSYTGGEEHHHDLVHLRSLPICSRFKVSFLRIEPGNPLDTTSTLSEFESSLRVRILRFSLFLGNEISRHHECEITRSLSAPPEQCYTYDSGSGSPRLSHPNLTLGSYIPLRTGSPM